MGKVSGAAKPKRQYYDAEFKLRVVRDALRRPAGSRIKPTCRKWAGIEPVSDIPQQICARPRPKFCAPPAACAPLPASHTLPHTRDAPRV